MPDPRLNDIYLAAGRLFNKKRYANTKVAEIAEAAGVATGTIYNLFTSKKAILTFVIRASLDKGYLGGEIGLPIREAEEKLLLSLFTDKWDKVVSSILDIKDNEGHISRGFVSSLSDMFDLLADTLLATGNIETNADILPDLAEAFFAARVRCMRSVEDNLKLYMDTGEIRRLEYPRVHVQSIADILTWWAMNAYIAMPDIVVPREVAKKTAVDLLAHAYLKKYE